MQPTGELSWRISADLRDWQTEALDAWRAERGRGVASVVTGGGKTIFAYACIMGSGTTLIAAEEMNRRAIGMELDPLYVDVAVRRWSALTGLPARHAETGAEFPLPASANWRAT